jgi:hypothetical protein
MTEVFDLDALDAEANLEPFVFRFDGKEYTCPTDISVDVIRAIENDHVLDAMELIVGEEQWASLVAAKETFGVRRMAIVLSQFGKHLGIEIPNS